MTYVRWRAYKFPWFFVFLTLTACTRPTILEKMRQEGTLHVITQNGPITYYEGKDGPAGYEFELAKKLAENWAFSYACGWSPIWNRYMT